VGIFMDNQNMGSFGLGMGGGSLQAAMQRRNMGAGAYQQVSAGAAPEQVVPPTPDPTQGSMPTTASQTAQPDTELMTAIKALGSFITSESKARREAVQFQAGGTPNAQSY
jgi:hypothetical protein